MEELPDPRDRLTAEEKETLREAIDEWVIDAEGVKPHVASSWACRRFQRSFQFPSQSLSCALV